MASRQRILSPWRLSSERPEGPEFSPILHLYALDFAAL
jgi:hypothetical protein